MADDLNLDIPESQTSEPELPQGDEFEHWKPTEESSEAETEAAPESEAETEAEPAEEEKPRMVELGALHEERARRKEAEERIARMEDRFEQFRQRFEKPPEQAAPEDGLPDFDEDPATNLNERLRRQEELAQQQQQYAAQQQQLTQFVSQFHSKESEYAQQTPDYYSAAEYLRGLRQNHYEMMGYPKDTARQYVDQEAMQLAIAMTQNGVNPPEKFYEMARSAGYNPNAAPAAAAAPPESEAGVRRQAENASRATSAGSRGQPAQQVSLSDLASMSDDDFDKYTSGKDWAKLWQ